MTDGRKELRTEEMTEGRNDGRTRQIQYRPPFLKRGYDYMMPKYTKKKISNVPFLTLKAHWVKF